MSGPDGLPQTRRLLEIMRRLRDPDSGCPWDRAQDERSLARHTLEEAYELVDAIERGEARALRDELGDLLFQVVFLAQLGSERGAYDFEAVAGGIADKLTRRHPHVFEDNPSRGAADWELIKAEERRERGVQGLLADIPRNTPALTRATKLGKRAAQAGFDWTDAQGPREKIREELEEIAGAQALGDPGELEAEVGDLLLAVTSLARHLKVDPETALRRANSKFENRFAAMEKLASARGKRLEELDAGQLDELWEQSKAGIQA